MRVAILSAIDIMPGDTMTPRAFAMIGGRTVIGRQLEFALGVGCERIVCLSHGLPQELIDLQHVAEKAGARFQIIRDSRPLSGLVNASDEILIVTDGLVFDAGLARKFMGEDILDDTPVIKGRRILTLPAEDAVGLGFERIDRDAAWAGILLASGTLVEKLADLPADIDLQSSILRLALQSGARTDEIPKLVLAEDQWLITQSEEAVKKFEARWLLEVTSPATFLSPIRAIADRAAIAVLRRYTRPDVVALIVGGLSLALLPSAGLFAYLGLSLWGFVFLALAEFTNRFSAMLRSIISAPEPKSRAVVIWTIGQALLLDILLLATIVMSVMPRQAVGALFAGFVALGLVRLLESQHIQIWNGKIRELLTDRAMLALFFACGVIGGSLVILIQLFAAMMLIAILLWFYRAKLTQT